MMIFFHNRDDANRIYSGELITNPENVNEHTIYIDVLEPKDVLTNSHDWKQQYIKSVSMEDVVFYGTFEDFKEKAVEYFL